MVPARRQLAFAGSLWIVTALTLTTGCRRPEPHRAPVGPPAAAAAPAPAKAAGHVAEASEPEVRPLRRCFPELPSWVDPVVADLLDRAASYQDDEDFAGVLACAEEAARQAPRSVEAHHNRALALMRLGRFDDARDAIALAMAIAPEDGECLELAAELYINRLEPTAERTSIGLEFARRGRRTAAGRNRARAGRLALLEGQALVDLGRSSEALAALGVARKLNPSDVSARYEQGVALFELCRFPAARRAFDDVLAEDPDHAHALYHLALISEREGHDDQAARLLREASARDAKSFPPAPDVGAAEFDRRVRAALAHLPRDVRDDLRGIPVETAELPASEDLTAEKPPLSPTILGLFRGLPIGRDAASDDAQAVAMRGPRGRQARVPSVATPADGELTSSGAVPARAIVVYRRNILRSIHGEDELDKAIERTLLHEVGHLRGEDDGSLRDRGLE